VSKEHVRNVAHSVHVRLLRRMHETGEDFQYLLKRYTLERLLYRVGESPYRHQFILKGAMLFVHWSGAPLRVTQDVDFLAFGDSGTDRIADVFRSLCRMELPNDGVVFAADTVRTESIRDRVDEYVGVRVRLQASLGKAVIPLRADIGFGDAVEPGPEEIEYPTLLGFPPPRLRAYPREAMIAEKLHAMVYWGTGTSRLKDFYDIYALASQFSFDGQPLAAAIEASFRRRQTPVPEATPPALAPPFFADDHTAVQWAAFARKTRLPEETPPFTDVGELLRSFLLPPIRAVATASRLDQCWPPGGPWQADAAA
jgi:predicted nucleotidyltransferase component of viral defense system